MDLLKTKFYPVDVLRQAIFLVPKDRERDIGYSNNVGEYWHKTRRILASRETANDVVAPYRAAA
jgi:hypothetical protein